MEMPAWMQSLVAIAEYAARVVGFCVAIGGGMAAFGRFLIVPPIRQYRAVMQGFARIAEFHERLDQQDRQFDSRLALQDERLRAIHGELRPNGGTSLRDAVDRMAVEMARVRGVQTKLLNDSSIASFQCDPVGECTDVNDAYLKLVGRDRDEVLGSNWLNCIDLENRDLVKQVWEDSIYNRRIFELRYRYVQPGGRRILALVRAEPVMDGRQRVVMWLGSVHPEELGGGDAA